MIFTTKKNAYIQICFKMWPVSYTCSDNPQNHTSYFKKKTQTHIQKLTLMCSSTSEKVTDLSVGVVFSGRDDRFAGLIYTLCSVPIMRHRIHVPDSSQGGVRVCGHRLEGSFPVHSGPGPMTYASLAPYPSNWAATKINHGISILFTSETNQVSLTSNASSGH